MPTYIAIYHGFKDLFKDGIKNPIDDNGNIYVGGAVIGGVYQYLLAITGKGYFEAKDYLKVLTEVGGPISEAMKQLADDNQVFRDMHTDLTTLDTELLARKQGITVDTSKPVDEQAQPEQSN